MRDPCSTANMGFKPLLLLVLSVSKDIRFSLGWNQYGIYHSWWDGIYRETCIEYTCTYILLHTYTLHYITLHYITLCELICTLPLVSKSARTRARVRESTGAPVFARASRACTCEMLARSRCAPHGWWGTIYELICFESSQNITSSGYFGLPLAFGIWWDLTQPCFKDAINEMHSLASSFGLWILWKIVYFEFWTSNCGI